MEVNNELDEKRKVYLNELKSKNPNSKVIYINQATKEFWKEEKEIKDCNENELQIINLSKQPQDAIILDIEEKYKLPDIKEKLNARKWNYSIWDTGSRGYHIYIHFVEFMSYDLELRNRLRMYIIKQFDTDDKVAKESQWISMPWTKHFKTGNHKTLIEEVNTYPTNLIEEDIVKFCKDDLQKRKNQIIVDDEQFKTLYENEPYLKFALTNKILDGERNDVLFKNLGVLLGRSPLPNEQIQTIAQKIVDNCPGKNIGEFMGWVHKARAGELREFNKYELINWSIKYGRKPLYEVVDDSEYIDLLDVKQLWDIIWSHRIAAQPVWKDLAFYNMIGTVLDEREDDLRLHVIFSSYSSSGKDEGLNLIEDILNQLNYKCFRPGEATDRTLIGSINQFAIEYNTKNELTEDCPINGKHEYKEPKEEGILAYANWVAFGEAESVFRPGAHNQKVQLYLRQAMDKRRQIEKGVGGIFLKINTNTTFALTTYKMDDTISKLLHNGLFQRAVFYDKIVTEQEHEQIVTHINKHKYSTLINELYDERKYMFKLCEKLKNMKLWFEENKLNIKYIAECNEYVDYRWKQLQNNFNGLMKIDKEIMCSMVRRSANNLYKLTKLNAAYKQNNTIGIKEIDESFNLLEICLNSIKYLIIGTDKRKKVFNGVLSIIQKESGISKMNLYTRIKENLGIKTPNLMGKIINDLLVNEFVDASKSGKADALYLTEKGKRALGLEEDE